MEFINLPDDVLVYLFKNFLNLNDLLVLSTTCKKLSEICNNYKMWSYFKTFYPIMDYSYPYGYDKHSIDNHKDDLNMLKMVPKWINDNNYYKNIIYEYPKKMLPFIQIDKEDSSLYLTDAHRIVNLELARESRRSKKEKSNRNRQIFNIHSSTDDVKGFIKKESCFFSFSEDKILGSNIKYSTENGKKEINVFNEIIEPSRDVNSIDFSTESNKLVYGCKNGSLKIFNLNENRPLKTSNIKDKILKIAFSPTIEKLAVGTAGIVSHLNYLSSPLRLYDVETFKETNVLMPSNDKPFKRGAGILAISFIDENTLLGAGYDTFIRVFDLRSQNCVQSFEEPEDMAIYCVCCSSENGMLSGNDRFCLIRYWDRRQCKIIRSFEASEAKSPIYSLSCTTEAIFAGWEQGVTAISFK